MNETELQKEAAVQKEEQSKWEYRDPDDIRDDIIEILLREEDMCVDYGEYILSNAIKKLYCLPIRKEN